MLISLSQPEVHPQEVFSAFGSRSTRQDFEEALKTRVGARHCVAFAYGHAGYLALIKALGLQGAEIILPAYTCMIVPEVIRVSGNIPVFVDVNPDDYSMNLDELEKAITDKTRLITATHMHGYQMPIQPLREIVGNRNIHIYEDSALAFPGVGNGSSGARGDSILYSFGTLKPLYTIRGGAVLTNDGDLYEKLLAVRKAEMSSLTRDEFMKRWAIFGMDFLTGFPGMYELTTKLGISKKALGKVARGRGITNSDPGIPNSEFAGDFNTVLTDFQSRIGISQLQRLDSIIARRRQQAELYAQILDGIPGLTPAPLVEGASYTPYTVRVEKRDEIGLLEKMLARGIEVGRTFHYAAPSLPRYTEYARGEYPNAERAGREAVNLPSHSFVTREQSMIIANELRNLLKKVAD